MHPYDLLVLGWGQEDIDLYVGAFLANHSSTRAAAYWWRKHGNEAKTGGPVNMGWEELTGTSATVLPGYKPSLVPYREGKFE